MTSSDPPPVNHLPPPSNQVIWDSFRAPLEQCVSAYLCRDWRFSACTDLNDLASHPCSILSDGTFSVFVKFTQAQNGLDQFEVEMAGLQFLAKQAGVATPVPIGITATAGGVILILKAAQAVARTAPHWRQMGQTLARIHQVPGQYFGFEQQGYFGPLYQDNRPAPDWPTFYAERRLWPRLMGSIESGHLPTAAIRQIERLISRLPQLDLPEVHPVLLHGDAQKNNFISTASGTLVIDPAIYYGSPEIDLAYVDYFEPVPAEVFLGYQEIRPIAPGFEDRKELWRVSAYLAAVTVEGAVHLEKLNRAVQSYL